MLIGRFLFIMPLLAVAGSLAAKKKIPATSGTFPTHGPLFVGLLVGTVIIVGALTFFPALSLGPIVEHFLMHEGKLFSLISGRSLELARCPRRHTRTSRTPRRHCFRRGWRARGRCSIRRSCGARLKDSFVKLNPLTLAKNPVMFVVEVGAAITTILLARDAIGGAPGLGFPLQIAIWLWFTVLFANFAEAMAEARGKAQADTLRKTKTGCGGEAVGS